MRTKHGIILPAELLAAGALFLTACAGGATYAGVGPGTGTGGSGDGGGSTTSTQASVPTIYQFANAAERGNGSTGTYEDSQPALTITAPSAASAGANPALGPSAGPLSTGQALPLNQSVISVGPSATGPDMSTNQTGATLTLDNWNPSGTSQFRLSIPGLAVDYTISSSTLLKSQDALSTGTLNIITSNMNYAFYGLWEADTFVSNPPYTDAVKHVGAFVTGYQTSPSAMPTSGTASYAGTNNVTGILTFYPSYGGMDVLGLKGDASFSVNFATGSVSGNFVNMTSGTAAAGVGPWNDVSVSGSIANGTSNFSGTTSVTSAPLGPTAMGTGGAGLINGSFYGPSAQELGAVWSLSDGTETAIGVVGAHR